MYSRQSRIEHCSHDIYFEGFFLLWKNAEVIDLIIRFISVLRFTREYFTHTLSAENYCGRKGTEPGGKPQSSAGCFQTFPHYA